MEIYSDSDFNDDVKQWTGELIEELKDELDALGVQHYKNSPNRTPLRNALKGKFYTRDGRINRIGIAMPRTAVFLHKGVSRGHPVNNPRTPKKWFNTVVNRNMQSLRLILAKHSAAFVVNHIYIK